MKKQNKRLLLTSLAVVAVLAAAIFLIWGTMNGAQQKLEARNLSSFQVAADLGDSNGVEADTGFTITCDASFSKKDLESLLVLSPETEYTITKVEAGRFALKTAQPLVSDTLYNVTLGDSRVQQPRSWAFQTKRPVGVRSSSPSDGVAYVETELGLEFTLSHRDLDISSNFSIQPPTPGRWEHYNSTQVFIPDAPLAEDTLYQVVIKAGAQCAAGEMAEDYRLKFRTRSSQGKDGLTIQVANYRYLETFLTADTVVLDLNSWGRSSPVGEGQVTILRLPDVGAYLGLAQQRLRFETEELGSTGDFLADIAGLEPVLQFSSPLYKNGDEYSSRIQIPLPEKLPAGYYLAQVDVNDDQGLSHTVQKQIQICDVAAYSQNRSGQALVWLNDTTTGAALSGARVELAKSPDFAGAATATTDQDGIATLATPVVKEGEREPATAYLRVLQGDRVIYADVLSLNGVMELREGSTIPLEELYYSMLYSDRAIYQPTDTIDIWGFLNSRKGDPLPKQVSLSLEGTGITPLKVDVAADGSFTGKLTLESVISGYWQLQVLDDKGVPYCSTGVQISQYLKPEYVLKLSADKPYYTLGEPANVTLEASFYDGTPAPGLEFTLDHGNEVHVDGLKTDREGLLKASFNVDLGERTDPNSCEPTSYFYQLNSTDPQNQQYYASDSLLVLPRSVLLQSELEITQDAASLLIMTNKLDTSAIPAHPAAWSYSMKDLTGDPVDLPVRAQIIRVDYIRDQIGQTYDYINKVTIPKYQISTRETVTQEVNLVTKDGQVALTGLEAYQPDDDGYYYVKLFCSDLNNQPVEAKAQIGQIWNEDLLGTTIKSYALSQSANGKERYYEYESINMKYGESMRLGFYENGRAAQNQGRLLTTVLDSVLVDRQVTGDAWVNFTMDATHMPNVEMSAAYFDGRHLFPVEAPQFYLDTTSMAGEIAIHPDKEAYAPGEEATVDIALTDKSGKPLEGCYVISVVDEAIFALAPQNYDAAADLYSYYYYPSLIKSVSYVQYDATANPDTAGGMGGGGGEDGLVRKRFLDTALFVSGRTDKNGKAQAKLTLPDNLTSWRITAVAVDSQAALTADGTANVQATIPLFVSPIISTQYLDGDDVVFTSRVYGSGDLDLAKTRYTAQLLGPDRGAKQLTFDGPNASFNFGKLPQGPYTVTLTASCGDEQDALELPFQVVGSGMEAPVQQPVDLTQPLSLDALRYPVTITICDSRYTVYNQALGVLMSQTGRLVDQKLGLAYAAQHLNKDQATPYYLSAFSTVSGNRLQNYEGGIAPLGDQGIAVPLLSGRVAAAAPESLNDPLSMVGYLNSVIGRRDCDNTDFAAAYMGLAALKEPVLTDLRQIIDLDIFDTTQRAYLIAAMGMAGDQDGAAAAYQQYIAPLLVRENNVAYLPDSATQNRAVTFDLTASALLAATSLRSDDASLLAAYLCANPSAMNSGCLELLTYAKQFEPKQDTKASFSYRDATGASQTVKLSEKPSVSLTLGKDALEKANIKVLSGELAATASYIGLPDSQAQPLDGVTITKTVEGVTGDLSTLQPGDLATVTLDVVVDSYAPFGLYAISDYIPSGARFAGVAPSTDPNPQWYFQDQEAQKLFFSLYHQAPADRYDIVSIRETLARHDDQGYEGDVIWDRYGISTPDALALLAEVDGVSLQDIQSQYGQNGQSAYQSDETAAAANVSSTAPSMGSAPAGESLSGKTLADGSTQYRIIYRIRAALPGQYIIDSAHITQTTSGLTASTDRGTMTITE